MNQRPVLYIGVATPLVEVANVWLAEIPPCDDETARREKLRAFPRDKIGAYDLSLPDHSALAFSTGMPVSRERVQAEVEAWSGKSPQLINTIEDPVNPLDHRKALAELKRALSDQPLRIVSRVGLTLQQLQRDLAELRPEMALLNCHGTSEGCLFLEDGRARADVVPGERLFSALQPRPTVLFLAACYSEAVLRRAKSLSENPSPGPSPRRRGEQTPPSLVGKGAGGLGFRMGSKAGADWEGAVLVSVSGETPIEVTACVAFQSMFFPALLRGERAGDAFDAACRYVANDPSVGVLSVGPGEVSPSDKFRMNEAGRDVSPFKGLDPLEGPEPETESQSPPRVGTLRRSSERFVGRRGEMAGIINAILPRRGGINPGGERRIVTLTKEGGIGKTAIALEVSDWVWERERFPRGIFELSCEHLIHPQELLARLLTLFGVPPADQRGDLLALLTAVLPRMIPAGHSALLLLDNLDDLLGSEAGAPRPVQDETGVILGTALTAAQDLRILATCRWPLGLADDEMEVDIPPMNEGDGRDVFISHLNSPAHRLEVERTWGLSDSPIRQLVRMSGRHPQSLRLLARQMGRRGMTLEKLRDEAREDLLKVLADPLASDDEKDRLKKVEVSYALSYRHLSAEGGRLFERLSRLPGGVWCGDLAEQALGWDALLGENWRDLMERELDYYALVHFEPEGADDSGGTFEMLSPMREFAWKKYQAGDHSRWEETWVDFWRGHIRAWNGLISGRLPEGIDLPEDQRRTRGEFQQRLAVTLFARTQANWLALFEHAVATDGSLARSVLLNLASFCEFSGQGVTLKSLSQAAVDALRTSGGSGEKALAPCLVTLGVVQKELGEKDAARESYTEALDTFRRLSASHPAAFAPDVAMTLNNLGNVQADLGEKEAARESYTEALGIYRRLSASHPAAFAPDVATTLNNLGNVQSELGEKEAARESYTEALGIRRCLAESHPAAFAPAVAMTLNNLGVVQSELGEKEAARDSYTEALQIYAPLAAQWPLAFMTELHRTLRNYTGITPDTPEDPWWELWKQVTADSGA